MKERGEEFVFLGRSAPAPRLSEPAGLLTVEPQPCGNAPENVGNESPADKTAEPLAGDESLEQFGRRISGCKLCELHKGRTNFVFGAGDPDADLMFVGEGPGAEEDRQGLPFVGASGQLLTKIIASIGFSREEVYIANMVKCRPPGNRDPREEEITACNSHLRRQIALIKPKVIVTLGRHSAYWFHGGQDSMRALRGRVVEFEGAKVVSTYHPAALLRNPNYKRDTWEDMLLARKIYDELGGRPSSGKVFEGGNKG